MDRDNFEIEQLLRRVRPTEPSPEVRARITGAARAAWNGPATGSAWRIAFRRLAVSTAAAVVMVSAADYASRRAVAPWQSTGPAVARLDPAEIEDWLEMPYSPLVRQLVATRRPAGPDAVTLLDYMERMRETISETEQGHGPEVSPPSEGRSGLLMDRGDLRCCS